HETPPTAKVTDRVTVIQPNRFHGDQNRTAYKRAAQAVPDVAKSLRSNGGERMPHLLQKHMPYAAYVPAPQRRSDPLARKTSSEALHHQKPSRMFETSVRANSRESRCRAGESSSKKLLSSRETWYCSRNRYAGFSYRTLP